MAIRLYHLAHEMHVKSSDVLAKLRSACGKAAQDPSFAASLKNHGTLVRYLDERGYAKFFQKNDADSKEVARDLGMLKR